MSTDLSPVLSPHTEFFGQTVMRRMQSDNSMPREVPAVSSASSESDEPSPMGCSLADLSPGGKISLVSISLEGFILGNLTSLGSCLSFYYLFLTPSHFWRPPLFVSILAFFSFLRILHLCQMEYEEHKRRQLSDYIQREAVYCGDDICICGDACHEHLLSVMAAEMVRPFSSARGNRFVGGRAVCETCGYCNRRDEFQPSGSENAQR